MWGLDEELSEREMGRAGEVLVCTRHAGRSDRWHWWWRTPGVPKCSSGGSSSSGDGSSDHESDQSSLHLTMIEHPAVAIDQCKQVETSEWRLICQPSKMRNPRMQWHTIHGSGILPSFCWSGWDDQHFLPYGFCSLQGFPGNLARSLGKDANLYDVLETLDEH